jgi:uncharacterized membrane protein
VSAPWTAVALVGAGTVVLKAVGPVVLAGRELPPRLAQLVEALAAAVLAALVITQTVGGNRELVLDEKLVGVGAAAVAVALRAPLLAVIVLAAVATGLARAVF